MANRSARSERSASGKNKPTRPARRKAKSKAAPPSLRNRVLSVFFRPRLLLVTGLVAATVVLAPAIRRLLPDLTERPEYRLKTAAIQIPERPTWVPETLIEQVCERADIPEEVSVLEPGLADRISQAFGEHPWVEGEVTVQLSVPAAIHVEFAYRKPVAMVAISDGFYPVDDQGTLLPPQDFAPSAVERFPAITGLSQRPGKGLGEPWGDDRVTGAARLAVVLVPYWREWNLQAIEVPPKGDSKRPYDDLEFTVTTHGGSRINWGRAPGHHHPLEITEEQKIGRLKKFLARGQTFDRPWEIDINHFMEVSYRPLEASNRRP